MFESAYQSLELQDQTTTFGLKWKYATPENALPIDKQKNHGGHPIKAGHYAQIDLNKPENSTPVTYQDTNGEIHYNLPKYIADIAEEVKKAHENGEGIITISENSSGLDLTQIPSNMDVTKVRAIEIKTISQVDLTQLARQLQTFKDQLGLIKIFEEEEEIKSIQTPAAVDSAAENDWIEQLATPRQGTEFEIIATSQKGGNIVTGARGENRRALHTKSLTVIDGNGGIRYVTDPDEVDSYYGTQGYAGMVVQAESKIEKQFPNTELVILPINGVNYNEAYGENLPTVLSELYEYSYFQNAYGENIHIEAIEFMDESGCSTVLRHTGGEGEAAAYAKEFNKKYLKGTFKGAICIRLRHGLGNTLKSALMNDDPGATRFFNRIYGKLSMDLNVVPELGMENFVDDSAEIEKWWKFRKMITEEARSEGKAEGNATATMDEDLVLSIDGLEPTQEADIDNHRNDIRQLIQLAMQPSLDALKEIEEVGGVMTWYGHLASGQKRGTIKDGGLSDHARISGKKELKKEIQRINAERSAKKHELHGTQFGQAKWIWHEGEKHNPNNRTAVLKAIELYKKRMTRRAQTLLRGGKTFGFRMPESYRKTMMKLVSHPPQEEAA